MAKRRLRHLTRRICLFKGKWNIVFLISITVLVFQIFFINIDSLCAWVHKPAIILIWWLLLCWSLCSHVTFIELRSRKKCCLKLQRSGKSEKDKKDVADRVIYQEISLGPQFWKMSMCGWESICCWIILLHVLVYFNKQLQSNCPLFHNN